jgi:hypothetical protein
MWVRSPPETPFYLRAMKIIHTTKKYLHVRMTEEEYNMTYPVIKRHEELMAMQNWWTENVEQRHEEDEYGSIVTRYYEKSTGKMVRRPHNIF